MLFLKMKLQSSSKLTRGRFINKGMEQLLEVK